MKKKFNFRREFYLITNKKRLSKNGSK